jgi:membrane protease YdiL (CAAX protease family)
MKKCTYCGKEYPNDVAVCLIDEQPLSGAESPPLILKELSAGILPPQPVRQSRPLVLTDRQMETVEVVLVCIIAFGASLLTSTYVYFGGDLDHKYGSFAWGIRTLQEGSCLALLWYLLRRRGRSFGDLGLAWSWNTLGWALILIFTGNWAFRAVYFLIHLSGLTTLSIEGVSGDVGKFLFGGGIFLSTIIFQLINPFFEELIARAYVMTEVRRLTNSVTKAVLISTVLQTSYHFYQGAPAAIAHGATFLIYSLYYAKTNRIAPVILAHLYQDVWGTLHYWLLS